MHFLTGFFLIVALKSTLIASEVEDLFSSNPDSSTDVAFNLNLGPENTEQTIFDLNDPASNPNEFLFDSQSLDTDPNIPISDLDRYTTISSNAGFDDIDPASDSTLLASSCQVEGTGQINDILRARDNPACKTEDLNIPLDFGTDSWWRRLIPSKKPTPKPGSSPSPGVLEPKNVPMISPDIFRGFFNEIDEERRCPKEFPIRCCSGYVMGYQAGYQGGFQYRTVYFMGSDDCIPILDIEECPLKYDACCQNPGLLNIYNCILMGHDPLTVG